LPIDAVLLIFAGAALVKLQEKLSQHYPKRSGILKYKAVQ
jgi:hypothetical protein